MSVEIDVDQLFRDSLRDALKEGIKSRMNYSSQISRLVDESIATNQSFLRGLVEAGIESIASDETFRAEFQATIRDELGRQLVKRFGGLLEKQVNDLKSDPVTRARIVTALEEIVKSKV